MFNKLYFICPTDNIESIINSKLNDNNFYITSLANSITFNYDFIKELHSIIESKKISEITFVLSDDHKLINDAIENKEYENYQISRLFESKNFVADKINIIRLH